MKIVLYANRNVGLIALSHLVSVGHEVSVITDGCMEVSWLARRLGCEVLAFEEEWGKFDLFMCVHGRRIIPKERLADKKFVNVHPLLAQGLKGKNPVKRYLEMGISEASISSHYMTEVVDEGEVIETVHFIVPEAKNYADFYNEAFKWYWIIIDKTMNKLLNK